MISNCCQISILNQTRDLAISIDKNFQVITTLSQESDLVLFVIIPEVYYILLVFAKFLCSKVQAHSLYLLMIS